MTDCGVSAALAFSASFFFMMSLIVGMRRLPSSLAASSLPHARCTALSWISSIAALRAQTMSYSRFSLHWPRLSPTLPGRFPPRASWEVILALIFLIFLSSFFCFGGGRGWVGTDGMEGMTKKRGWCQRKKEIDMGRFFRGAAPQLFTARCTGREAQIVCILWKKVYVRKGTVRRRAGLSFPCSVMSLVEAGRSFV